MTVWALADLHLSFGVPGKSMDLFGTQWQDHFQKIKFHWEKQISKEDLILIPGDTSWAMHPEEAVPDLGWIDNLPGTKLLLRGNHDYWWTSLAKLEKILPPSLHLIQNNTFQWNDISVGGARLWDTEEYQFNSYIERIENPNAQKNLNSESDLRESEKVFQRELGRLEASLRLLNPSAKVRIAMTHYPPIGPDLYPSMASALLEKFKVDICVFGHLHSIKANSLLFGERNGIKYYLTSCDYLNFNPLKIWEK